MEDLACISHAISILGFLRGFFDGTLHRAVSLLLLLGIKAFISGDGCVYSASLIATAFGVYASAFVSPCAYRALAVR
jgi:hypothetical protein